MNTQDVGRAGEERAAAFLRGRGYEIITMNFRARMGEIDIIARDNDTVVFVEVKARAGSDFGGALGAVGSQKRRKLIRTAAFYAQKMALDCPLRFDVVALEGDRVEHVISAFEAN